MSNIKIGYGKLGRALPLPRQEWGILGGDCEPPQLLCHLAQLHPQDTFYLLTRNSGENPQDVGFPPNVVNPWSEWTDEFKRAKLKNDDHAAVIGWYDANTLPVYREMDAIIMWAGQHGTSNSPIPWSPNGTWDKLTRPYDSFVRYGSYVVRGINAFRAADPVAREEIWLNPDARNQVKARDLKWPLRKPILSQYVTKQATKHERYGDPRNPEDCGFPEAEWDCTTWAVKEDYCYSRLEICSIMPWMVDCQPSYEWEGRRHFGIFINEARGYVTLNRRDIVKKWVLPLQPAFIHGVWPEKSQQELGITVTPAPWDQFYDLLRSVRCTFTTPSNGSGYATTKPWEAFAAGTVCFRHPRYDDQHHIYGDLPDTAREWLTPSTPDELWARVNHLQQDKDTWLYLVTEQRKLYDQAVADVKHVRMIEERIWV